MNNDLQAVQDFFKDKTFHEMPLQRDIQPEVSFTVSHDRIVTEKPIFIEKGNIIVIRGKSGCGKTSFAECLSGVEKGVICDRGYSFDYYTSKIAYMRQDSKIPTLNVTLLDLFSDDRADSDLIIKVLGYAKMKNWFEKTMKGRLDVKIQNLSGGEVTRIRFAMTLYHFEKNQCQWLILDEPEQGLDPNLAPEMLITAFEQYRHASIIIITHMCDCQLIKLPITHEWTIDQSRVLSSKPYVRRE
jgi:ABC-type transport system involved in cytochrome bd biosynthesis fused ATPase/permease subunit